VLVSVSVGVGVSVPDCGPDCGIVSVGVGVPVSVSVGLVVPVGADEVCAGVALAVAGGLAADGPRAAVVVAGLGSGVQAYQVDVADGFPAADDQVPVMPAGVSAETGPAASRAEVYDGSGVWPARATECVGLGPGSRAGSPYGRLP
jgi:hypothetical protein